MASSEEVGRRLLGQVEVLGFDEVLRALRAYNETSNVRYINVPAIDVLLNIVMQHHPLKRIPVLDLISEFPNTGTESMIYHMLAAMTLPVQAGQHRIGGAGSAVVICDADMRLDVSKLADAMRSFTARDQTSADQSPELKVVESVIETAMQHVYVYSPQSLSAMIATIASLSDTLLEVESHNSGNRELGAVILCDLSTFFWQNKMELEVERDLQHESDLRDHSISKGVGGYNGLIASLRACHERLGCTIVATSWGSGLQKDNTNPAAYSASSMHPQLPSVWTSFCALSLVVRQQVIPKFINDMTIAEIWTDASTRQKALDNAKYSATIHWAQSHERHGAIRQALKLDGHGGSFQFTVTDKGVTIVE